jgi:hypothetical protein
MTRTRSFPILKIDPAHNTSLRTKARKETHSLSVQNEEWNRPGRII